MNKKGHTRKPVIRGPLPEKDWITLCELVTWRATGKARSAATLRRLMRRRRGRKPAFLWASFERAAATVVSLCRKNDLSPYGSVGGNPHQPFSEEYFLSDVYADYVSDSIGPDPRAWPRASPYPDENPEEPRELSIYRSVRFFRSDLLSTSGRAGQPAAETAQAPAWGTQDDAAPAQAVSEDAQDAVAIVDAMKACGDQLQQAAELSEPIDPASSAGRPNRRGRRKGVGGYDSTDMPLIKKMRRLIKRGEATSPSPAALMVVDKAVGKTSVDNKVKRLVRKYLAHYSRGENHSL